MASRRRRRVGPKTRAHLALLRRHRWCYDLLLRLQKGGCAICGAPPRTRRLDLDHDHKTMKIRGLLCVRCNRTLPAWVSPAWLRAAADYLENPPFDQIEQPEGVSK